MTRFLIDFVFVALVLTTNAQPVPNNTANAVAAEGAATSATAAATNSAAVENSNTENSATGTTNTEQQAGTVNTESVGAGANNYEQPVYAGILTPDAFQQYVNQFGTAYAPYPGYPAPVGYAVAAAPQTVPGTPQAIYPSPIVVQTGYEGFLVPTTATPSPAAPSTSSMSTNPFTFIANLVSSILMSTAFRVLAAIASAIGMAFFGSALLNAICNVTSLCRTLSVIRREATSESLGRMLADELTPERVRRTTEFVRNAVRKYRELQQLTSTTARDN